MKFKLIFIFKIQIFNFIKNKAIRTFSRMIIQFEKWMSLSLNILILIWRNAASIKQMLISKRKILSSWKSCLKFIENHQFRKNYSQTQNCRQNRKNQNYIKWRKLFYQKWNASKFRVRNWKQKMIFKQRLLFRQHLNHRFRFEIFLSKSWH